jgi:NADH-quinone oxidoreductase subunit N
VTLTLPAITAEFYLAAAPILILCVTAMVALLMAVSSSETVKNYCRPLNYAALFIATCLSMNAFVTGGSGVESYLSGGYLDGRLGSFGQVMILVISLIVSLLMSHSYQKNHFNRGEIIALFHMVIAGMLTMVATDDLITMFVGLEMASIGVYAIIGYMRPTKISQEAAVKYFVLGSIAAAVLLMGFGFIYAATGSLKLSEISSAFVAMQAQQSQWLRLGTIFTVAGIGFKMALVPFHMWTADAYEGAPTGMTAFMATAMKAMIMVAAVRVFTSTVSHMQSIWIPAISFLAAASLIAANIMALAQQSVKRLLAYSSIAHSGYMALALAGLGASGKDLHQIPSVLFYLVGYVAVSLGVFAIVMWLESDRCDNLIVDDLAGLGKKHPYTAIALAVFMFSLGGMPPTIGFIGKFYAFNAAIQHDLIWLVVVAAIGSTISLYYYMRVIVRMFMNDVNPALLYLIKPTKSAVTIAVVALSLLAVILGGTCAPESVMRLAHVASAEAKSDVH